MSVVVKLIGLDRKGFRVKANDGTYRTVSSAQAVTVDVTDAAVQRVLKRNTYRFLAFPVSTSLLTSPSVSLSTSPSSSGSASKSPSSSASLSVSPSSSKSPSASSSPSSSVSPSPSA